MYIILNKKKKKRAIFKLNHCQASNMEEFLTCRNNKLAVLSLLTMS